MIIYNKTTLTIEDSYSIDQPVILIKM